MAKPASRTSRVNKQSDDASESHKKENDRGRADKSRSDRKTENGDPFSVNMHEKNKIRLKEICVHFGHEDMLTRQKATGRIFSKTIMNVVDYYYITAIITPKNDNTKLLINAFKAVWKLCISQNKTFILKKDFESLKNKKEKKRIEEVLQLTANKMTESKHYIPPYLFNNHFDKRNKKIWVPNDILNLLDTQTVITKIDKMEQ